MDKKWTKAAEKSFLKPIAIPATQPNDCSVVMLGFSLPKWAATDVVACNPLATQQLGRKLAVEVMSEALQGVSIATTGQIRVSALPENAALTNWLGLLMRARTECRVAV
ncbi:MAG: hypothetical protein SFZ03_03505 [Candidatus Melainabacteria bacterium]|nr:hypothetical protein [Candidatus Melainabacteria bacterium]